MEQDTPKAAIVTGAYGAIGFAIAKKLADLNFEVILVGRNERRLEEAVSTILTLNKAAQVWYEVVDLSSLESIKQLHEKWEGPLNVLINNASTTPQRISYNGEGFESQFATNILGYFRMTQLFSEFMKNVEDARIINVASYWAGDLRIDDLEFKERIYHNAIAYRQSKQANRMLTYAFADLLKDQNIMVNTCHPGEVNSKLSNSLGFGGHESPEFGAETPVWLASDPSLKNITGKYFEYKEEKFCEFSQNKEAIDELYRFCCQFT